jgi:hypothetical protein
MPVSGSASFQRLGDLLQPGPVAVACGRHAKAQAPVLVARRHRVVPPVFQREGRVHDDAVELLEAVLGRQVPRVTQAVALLVLPHGDAVQDHVDARDVVGGDVGFLPVQLQLPHVAAMLLDVPDALQEQAARAAGPVAHRHAGPRLQHLGHQKANLGRRVELAAGLARLAGEVADEVFVGVAEQVIGDVRAVEGLAAEVVDQVDQLVAGQFVLLVEVDLAGEDAVEVVLAVSVRPLDGQHGLVQGLAELPLGCARHVSPGRVFGHREVVVLRVSGQQQCLVARHARLDQRVGLGADLFVVAVADALVEEQREHVAAELGMVGVATQDVGGLVEIGLQLALRHAPRGADDDGRVELGEQFL